MGCEQAEQLCQKPEMNNGETLALKNLFLKDKKKKNNFYLVTACVDTEIRLKEVKFAKQVSFASPDNLKDKLNLLPGSVTPLGLLNDGVVVDADSTQAAEQCVEFHVDPRMVADPEVVVDCH